MHKKIGLMLAVCILAIMPVHHSFAAAHPAGTNIVKDGTVYMITAEGQRRPYTSAGAFLSYGFNSWGVVAEANTDDIALPIGNFIPPRDGKIICSDRGTDKGTCYLITNGKRAGFTSATVFKILGFDFAKALYGDVSFLENDTDISNTNETHRPGVLVNRGGTIYIIGSEGLYGIPSMETLKSWGYSLQDAITANNQDQQLQQARVITDRTAGQLQAHSDTNFQFTPPAGSNASSTTAVIDFCNNLAGEQQVLPPGYMRTTDNNCYPKPVETSPQSPTSSPIREPLKPSLLFEQVSVNPNFLPNHIAIKLTANNEDYKFKAITIVPSTKAAFQNVDVKLCDDTNAYSSDFNQKCKTPSITYCEVLEKVFLEYSQISYPYLCPKIYSDSSPDTQFHAYGSTDIDWMGRPINSQIIIPKGTSKYFIFSKELSIPLLKFQSVDTNQEQEVSTIN